MSKVKPLQKKQVSYSDGVNVYLFAILANIVTQLLVQLIVSVIDTNLLKSSYFQLACMLIFQLAFLAVPIIYCKCVKKFRPQLLAPIAKPAFEVFLSVVLPVITMLGFFLPAQYFSLGLYKIGYNVDSGLEIDTAGKMVFGIIVMCIAAPIVEELIFRGFLLSGLRTRYNDYVAALLCALSFTFMHMNPDQTVYQFFLGYTCALTAIKCRNLIGPIIIHALSNLIAVLLYIPAFNNLVGRAYVKISSNVRVAVVVTVLLAVAAGVAIFFICFAMNKLRMAREAKKEQQPDEPQAVVQATTEGAGNIKLAKILYGVTIGLCALMWFISFLAGMITLPALPTGQ